MLLRASVKMFYFKHPFTCIIAGPTQSGKTQFTLELLDNISSVMMPSPTKVIWCYGEYQAKLKDLPKFVTVVEGLKGIDEVDPNERNLLILDDLMQEAGNAKDICDLFTKGSHHRNLSIILIAQNLFHQGKMMRTISLNTHYFVLFKNPRDANQIRFFGNQLFPGQIKFLVDAYKQATSRAFGYLLLDLTQSTPENQRVLSDILPSDESDGGYYYVPK
jgi:hypothetical protein